MKEERNINIYMEASNPALAREYIAYLERKDARRREERERIKDRFLAGLGNALFGIGLISIVTLAIIGLIAILP